MPHTYYPTNNKQTNKKQTILTQASHFKPSISLSQSADQTEFKPFAPSGLTYKVYQNQANYNPKLTNPPAFQFYNPNNQAFTKHRPLGSSELSDNFSYFNFGGDSISTTPVYSSLSSSKIVQNFYTPKNTNQNIEASSLTPQTASSHVQYTNIQGKLPLPNKKPLTHKHYRTQTETQDSAQEEEENAAYETTEEVEEEPQPQSQSQSNSKQSEENLSISLPTPPSHFNNNVNKYENIKNPFADPNFNFDKFLGRLRQSHDSYHFQQHRETEPNVKPTIKHNEKVPYNKFGPENVDLRKPVAFSSPGYKQENSKEESTSLADDYYYDDNEPITEKNKKHNKRIEIDNQAKQQHPKTITKFITSDKELKAIDVQINIKPIIQYNNNSTKPNKNKQVEQEKKKFDEEYEYYDDYDYSTQKVKQPSPEEQEVVVTTKKYKHPQTTHRNKETAYHKPKYTETTSTTNRPVKSHQKPSYHDQSVQNSVKVALPNLKEVLSQQTIKPSYTVRPRKNQNTDSSRIVTTTYNPWHYTRDVSVLRPTTLRPYLDDSAFRNSRLNNTDVHR